MTKDKRAIGFVTVTVDVELTAPCWKLYLNSPYVSTRTFIQADQSELSTKKLKTKELTIAVFRLLTISKSLVVPKVLSPISSFPQVVVVCIVYAFVCFWIRMWQVPFLILGIVFINGLLSSGVERFSTIMIWNNCVSPGGWSQYPFSRYFDDIATIDEKFLATLDQLLVHITNGIDMIEMTFNITSFADVCISYVFYISCFALSFVVSFLLGIFSVQFVVVLIGTIVMLTTACRSVLFSLKSIDDKDDTSGNTSPPATQAIMNVVESLLVFCCRIPNDLDIEHRLIAKQAVVKHNGIEMQECKDQITPK
jgi:hypothetical protein